MSPPLIVEVLRGGFVESRHEVDVAVVGADGHRSGWGSPARPVLARSSLKPIQAFPLVATGAADAFELGDVELALACASHSGEPTHVAAVDAWLDRIGCSVDDLECGPRLPLGTAAAEELLRSGGSPDRRHSDCSGKHTGFLTVCRHLGIDPAGYLDPHHPLQAAHVTKAIEAACDISTVGQAPAVDGCGIPVWEMPLDRLAGGWATLAGTEEGGRLYAAMLAAPFFVAGTDRSCTRVMEASGEVVVKTGAEGVFCGVHPASGLGWALKCRDGAARGAEAALLWLLADLGFAVDIEPTVLRNFDGTEVGAVRVRGGR